MSSLVHDAAATHVATECEHLATLEHRLQTTQDNTRAMLYQLKNQVVVPDDDAWWRLSGVLIAHNWFPYTFPMPEHFATYPEWIWFETQLKESPHMVNAFSLWCVKQNCRKWHDLELVFNNVFLTQWCSLSHVQERSTGPPRGLAITCGSSFKVPHSYFSHPLLTPFCSYGVWYKSISCWGSMNKTRPKLRGGVRWCDPTLLYDDTWTQMTSLSQKLPHKKAFRCVLLIPDWAPNAVSIMEAWSASIPLAHTLLCTVPALNHPCCVGPSVFLSQPTNIHIHLVHNALAETQHPVYTHTIVSTLGEKIKCISGASFEPNVLGSFSPTSGYRIRNVWWHTWFTESGTRQKILNHKPIKWDVIRDSWDRVNAVISMCPLRWVRHFLSLRNDPDSTRPYSVKLLWSVACCDMYVGIVGQTFFRMQRLRGKHRKRLRAFLELPNVRRPPLKHGAEHLQRMFRTTKLSGKRGSADVMYGYMANLGAHQWCQTPIVLCWQSELSHTERFWIRLVHRPLNNKLPQRGTSRWRKLGRFRLYPITTFAGDLRSAVTREVASLRSPLSIRDQIQLLHSSQDRVEGTLWNKLFTKVSSRLKRETNIRLKKFLTVRVPNHLPSFRQNVARCVSSACSSGTGPRMARQDYSCRIQVVPTRSPTVGQLLANNSVEYTPSSIQKLIAIGCRCSTSDLCCPHPLNNVVMRPQNPFASRLVPEDLLPVWRQCMLSAILPSPETCYRSVASSVTTALKSIPGGDQVSIVNHATHLASLAWDDADVGMKFGDPHCMPNHIKMLKGLHPNMRYVKIDKFTGTCWLICEVL